MKQFIKLDEMECQIFSNLDQDPNTFCAGKLSPNELLSFHMKPTIKFVIPCEYGLIDNTGKITATGIFANVNLRGKPSLIIKFFVASCIIVPDGFETKKVSITIYDPNGKEFSNVDLRPLPAPKITDEEKKNKFNILAQFTPEFSIPGQYSISIVINEEPVAKIDNFFTVNK